MEILVSYIFESVKLTENEEEKKFLSSLLPITFYCKIAPLPLESNVSYPIFSDRHHF